jgi:large subunit ribosomal protein L16
MHRGNRAGLAYRGSTVAFGEYGLMAMERCWLDTKQIEAARVAIARNNPLRRSRWKPEWARAKAPWNRGWR